MQGLTFAKTSTGEHFVREVRARVMVQLETRRSKLGPNFVFWVKAGFWFTLCWGAYLLLLTGSVNGARAVFLAVVMSLSGLLLGFAVGHDASHGVLSRNRTVNDALHFVSFLTVGVDPLLWGLRHLRSHHMYPNVEGSDIDIDRNPLLRLSPTHPWKPKHRFQHLYAPLAYAAALAHSVFWGDWVYLLSPDYAWMRRGVSFRALWTRFMAFKIAHFLLMLLLPFALLPYSATTIVAVYLAAGAVASLAFILMLVGTHFFAEAAYPEPKDGKLPTSWAEHNLLTSCDWNPKSAFSRFVSGGANCHAAHHLFPNICHTYYGEINEIIEGAAKAHSITYHQKTLTQMMVSHFKHLKRMGERPTD